MTKKLAYEDRKREDEPDEEHLYEVKLILSITGTQASREECMEDLMRSGIHEEHTTFSVATGYHSAKSLRVTAITDLGLRGQPPKTKREVLKKAQRNKKR